LCGVNSVNNVSLEVISQKFGYRWCGNDRGKKVKGGLGFWVKANIHFDRINHNCKNILSIKCVINDKILILTGVYRAPSVDFNMVMQGLLEFKDKVKSNENWIILGDFNCRIGSLPSEISCDVEDEVIMVFNRESKDPKIYANGREFVSCMNSIKMVIVNGLKEIADITYDGLGDSVIDFICVPYCLFDKVSLNVKKIGGAIKYSDHRLVTLTFQNLSVEKNIVNISPKRKLHTIWSKYSQISEIMFTEWYASNQKLCWNDLKNLLLAAYHNSCSYRIKLEKEDKMLKQWINQKNHLRLQREKKVGEERIVLQEEYRSIKNKIKNYLQKKKRQQIVSQMNRLEKLRCSNAREYWSKVKNILNIQSKQSILPNVMKGTDSERKIMSNNDIWIKGFSDCILNIDSFDHEWFDYVTQKMLNIDPDLDFDIELNKDIELHEVTSALNRLKAGKAPGLDGIDTEILKQLSKLSRTILWKFINQIFIDEATSKVE